MLVTVAGMLCETLSSPGLPQTMGTNRFGSNVEYVHCINMMPFTPITEELLPYDFMQQEWPVLETAFDGDLGRREAGTERAREGT